MAIATADTMSATSLTTSHDSRQPVEWRAAFWRRAIATALPLELRLILMTTATVLMLVAAGAQIASAIGASEGQAAHQATYRALTATADTWQPDGICYAASTTPGMISAQDLAAAHTTGVRETQPGTFHACQLSGLLIPSPAVGAPSSGGQVILVSLSQGWLWAYQDGALVFANPVATGMPYLRTPRGTFHVQYKRADTTFYSPWPRSSPFYYAPEHVTYALNFRYGGFYIHDAPWRQMYGPGAQDPHTTPSGAIETGSHGCVNMTTTATAWLYQWARLGATVHIVE